MKSDCQVTFINIKALDTSAIQISNIYHQDKVHGRLTLYCVVFQDNVDLGDLMFSLCYLPTAGRLTITMIKARNLKAMDITGASGN